MKNILELLSQSEKRFLEKTFAEDESRKVTYKEFYKNVKSIATFLLKNNLTQKGCAIILDKSVRQLEAMLGSVGAGEFYTIIDNKMPTERINKILSLLQPNCIICDEANVELAKSTNSSAEIVMYEDMLGDIDESLLQAIQLKHIDTNPAYILFTSGSTGEPKGVVVSHRAVLAYSKWVCSEFNFDENSVFGSQTMFYFSMSVTDIFSTLRVGGTLVLIPKMLFSFPVKLIEYLNEKSVNTIYWVPTALSIVSNYKTFDFIKPEYLKKVLFAGEVMPTKQLNYWVDSLGKEIVYANLFGPTETTDICCFYRLNRPLSENESVPIGRHCDNCDVLIIDENGKSANKGEMYVRGSFLADGYYNNPQKTKEAFVQNPLNSSYPEIVYKTGDIAEIDEYGDMRFLSRKDFQIKHMGYRIELGEIEKNLNSAEFIKSCVCVYSNKDDKLIMFYEGKNKGEDSLKAMAEKTLPQYMRPNVYIKIKSMPITANGKTDRKQLLKQYEEM